MTTSLVELRPEGLYCPPGRFWIDPWQPVAAAVLTHAHADHARPGSESYLCAAPGLPIARVRLGDEARIEGIPYGASRTLGGVRVSLHPAGHVRGSAQVRLEHRGEVWVVSGDYKHQPDPTCAPFEPVSCHTLITESTFGLPIYRWAPAAETCDALAAWWRRCAEAGRPALLGCYALGKAQRVLAEMRARHDGPIFAHGAVLKLVEAYRASGVAGLDECAAIGAGQDYGRALVLAPPAALGSRWVRRFKGAEVALASGFMRVRGNRRWKAYDRGFPLSDHADWPALLRTVEASGASRVIAFHGSPGPFARYLRERRSLDAVAWDTRSEGDA